MRFWFRNDAEDSERFSHFAQGRKRWVRERKSKMVIPNKKSFLDYILT
jgi:hypothetical protein